MDLSLCKGTRRAADCFLLEITTYLECNEWGFHLQQRCGAQRPSPLYENVSYYLKPRWHVSVSNIVSRHPTLFVSLSFYFLRVEDGKKEKKKLYLPLLLVDELRSRLNDLIVCKNCLNYNFEILSKIWVWFMNALWHVQLHRRWTAPQKQSLWQYHMTPLPYASSEYGSTYKLLYTHSNILVSGIQS